MHNYKICRLLAKYCCSNILAGDTELYLGIVELQVLAEITAFLYELGGRAQGKLSPCRVKRKTVT